MIQAEREQGSLELYIWEEQGPRYQRLDKAGFSKPWF